MFKIFALSVAVAFMPLSQRFSTSNFSNKYNTEKQLHIFPYKNTITTNPFELEKKPAQAWSQNWMGMAQENIRKSEYYFKWEEKYNAYCTPNRKNNLRFFYSNKGFTVEPRTTKIPVGEFDPLKRPDEIKYKNIPNWNVKFNLDMKQVGKGIWKTVDNKAEYITDKITVQYINNDEGMRQNFIVHSPLSKTSTLKINFTIKTKLKTYLHGNQLQFFHKKTNVLNYDQLKVWDADGKLLEASIIKNKRNRFYIQVETKDAVYPITIDPISSTPAAILESNQESASFGNSVSSAGDVNGDGYSDVIVGASLYDNNEPNEGAAFIYHGSTSGIIPAAAIMLERDQPGASFGSSVSTAGDVNGDGYSDVIVGASGFNNGQSGEGAAFIYHGSATGISNTVSVMLESNQANASFGNSVATAGDVNSDGYSDVIVGSWLFDNGNTNEGSAFIYHGSATGIQPTVAASVECNQSLAFMGYSVGCAGDINADGFSDIIVGAIAFDNIENNEGAAFVYYGSATGINPLIVDTLECNIAGAQMGISAAAAGDVNGDGYSDVIVGADNYNNFPISGGAAFIFHGAATGISTVASIMLGSPFGGGMGNSVASAGDVNGDGFSDVIVGADLYFNGPIIGGVAFIYQGTATGIVTHTVVMIKTNQANAQMGNSVASAGDVNGDGYSDIIIGANLFDNPETDEGAAFVYHGSAAGLSFIPNSTPDDADDFQTSFGISVASAGDVNGDGFSDVIIGAMNFTEGANIEEGRAFVYHGSLTGLSADPNSILDDANQLGALFGRSVASAGDVNGDGYADVIIGADSYDDGANTDEGRAFVYHGSAAGLSASPNSTPDDANQSQCGFGSSVASAGDVNGDGYSDVIIGAPGFNDGANNLEGLAFVYHGSAVGLSTNPNNTPDDADQAGARFGYSVASAGDVNGDGYSDVVIGAYNYNDAGNAAEGRAFVYHGSATGLSANPNSIPDDADQPDSYFGASVSSAGDVNGDGFSDVIIGALVYDDGANADEGRAFVYHGSTTGISASPDNTPDDANQAGALFARSVASAGDVNGDGYSDIIIGAEGYNDGINGDEGRAFVYYGSVSGLSAIPNNTPDDADQANAFFGYSVASAGDINGDGYSDIIIGAHGFDDGANTDEGRAFVYNGNDSTSNKRNNLRMYNSDLTTPINSSNFVIGNFGAGLYAKSFLGKAKGKLVWETRINYNAYSGTPITNSTFFTAQQSTYTDLGLTGLELKNLIDKLLGSGIYTKIRARVKYDPVTAITGQVYGPWRNVSAIIDGNSLGALPLELISFNAAWLQKGKTAKINFTTDKESGICCFDILKSPDGFNFYSIGLIPAKNTSEIQSYNFIDNSAVNKKQFYRLKIKGNNGQVEYSNIQQLQHNGSTEILVFPNPTTDILQLQLNGTYTKINVQIVNTTGQIVYQMNNLSLSTQVLKIPVSDLPRGQYWLHLQSGSEKQVLQFVKL